MNTLARYIAAVINKEMMPAYINGCDRKKQPGINVRQKMMKPADWIFSKLFLKRSAGMGVFSFPVKCS